uniref:RNA-directed DNA polymerase n=1 Tax=Strigamia maritima TaxID=126957 RepID=T1IMZ1_STRMM
MDKVKQTGNDTPTEILERLQRLFEQMTVPIPEEEKMIYTLEAMSASAARLIKQSITLDCTWPKLCSVVPDIERMAKLEERQKQRGKAKTIVETPKVTSTPTETKLQEDKSKKLFAVSKNQRRAAAISAAAKAKISNILGDARATPTNGGCYRCGGGHFMRDCNFKPEDMHKEAKVKSEKVFLVLTELNKQLEELGVEDSDEDDFLSPNVLDFEDLIFDDIDTTQTNSLGVLKSEPKVDTLMVNINQKKPGVLPYLTVQIGGKKAKALFDCGASRPYISGAMLKHLNMLYLVERNNDNTVVVTGDRVTKSFGFITLNMSWKTGKGPVRFSVLSSASKYLLLGGTWMEKNGIVISMPSKRWWHMDFDKDQFPFKHPPSAADMAAAILDKFIKELDDTREPKMNLEDLTKYLLSKCKLQGKEYERLCKLIKKYETTFDENAGYHPDLEHTIPTGDAKPFKYIYLEDVDNSAGLKIVVPKSLQDKCLALVHDYSSSGHGGGDVTFERRRRSFFWVNCRQDTVKCVAKCDRCQRCKPIQRKPKGLLQPISAQIGRFERIGLDLMGPKPMTTNRNKFVLVIVDYATAWVEVVPLRILTLVPHIMRFFQTYGVPRYIVSDNGKQFVSDIYNALCEKAGIIPNRTFSYHPQTNYTERINRNIKIMLQIFTSEHKHWDRVIGNINFALCTGPSATTGIAPVMATFLKELRPFWDNIDVAYDAPFDPEQPHDALRMLMSRMANLLKTAISNKEKAQIKQKTNYDKHRSDVQFPINDLVLIKTHALSKATIRYSQSLEDRYKGPYVIIKKISSNAYEIAKPITLQSKGPVNISEMKLYILSDKPAGWPIADVDDDNEENLTAPSQTNPVASNDDMLATPQHTDESKDTVLDQSSKKCGKPQKTVASNINTKSIDPLPKKRAPEARGHMLVSLPMPPLAPYRDPRRKLTRPATNSTSVHVSANKAQHTRNLEQYSAPKVLLDEEEVKRRMAAHLTLSEKTIRVQLHKDNKNALNAARIAKKYPEGRKVAELIQSIENAKITNAAKLAKSQNEMQAKQKRDNDLKSLITSSTSQKLANGQTATLEVEKKVEQQSAAVPPASLQDMCLNAVFPDLSAATSTDETDKPKLWYDQAVQEEMAGLASSIVTPMEVEVETSTQSPPQASTADQEIPAIPGKSIQTKPKPVVKNKTKRGLAAFKKAPPKPKGATSWETSSSSWMLRRCSPATRALGSADIDPTSSEGGDVTVSRPRRTTTARVMSP